MTRYLVRRVTIMQYEQEVQGPPGADGSELVAEAMRTGKWKDAGETTHFEVRENE